MSSTVSGPMERPVLFSQAMVRAILDGRKTQTRRVILPQPNEESVMHFNYAHGTRKCDSIRCPYGQPGDRLWVRETWATLDCHHGQTVYRADGEQNFVNMLWRPSIHMPRWASRITLEIVSVRVERLMDITERDAEAEGVEPAKMLGADRGMLACHLQDPYRAGFADLWDSLNAKRGYGWDVNPWVWAITFKRHLSKNVTKSDDAMGVSNPNPS